MGGDTPLPHPGIEPGMSPVALWSASARGRAAKADGVTAEAQAGDSPRLHHTKNSNSAGNCSGEFSLSFPRSMRIPGFSLVQGLYCYCRYATISKIVPTGIFIAGCGEEAIGWKKRPGTRKKSAMPRRIPGLRARSLAAGTYLDTGTCQRFVGCRPVDRPVGR